MLLSVYFILFCQFHCLNEYYNDKKEDLITKGIGVQNKWEMRVLLVYQEIALLLNDW